MSKAIDCLLEDVIINENWEESVYIRKDGEEIPIKKSSVIVIGNKTMQFLFPYQRIALFSYKVYLRIECKSEEGKVIRGLRLNKIEKTIEYECSIWKWSEQGKRLKEIKKEIISTNFEKKVFNHLQEVQLERIEQMSSSIVRLEENEKTMYSTIEELIKKKH